jgi:hypothetical protein
MPGDLEPLSARVCQAGPAVLVAELLGRIRPELPAVGGLGEREQVLKADGGAGGADYGQVTQLGERRAGRGAA